MLVVSLVVVALASCFSSDSRSVRASLSRDRDGDDRAGDVLRGLRAVAHLADGRQALERALQAPLGHAQLERPAFAGGDLRRGDVAAEIVGDRDDLRRRAVDLAGRGGERDLRGALDVAAAAGRARRRGGDRGGRGCGAAGGVLRPSGLLGRRGLVGVGRRLARRRPAAAARRRVAAPAAVRHRGRDQHDEEDGCREPECGQRELRPRERAAALRGRREAPPRPLVERVGEGGVRGGALVAHEDRELGQVGQVGVDRATGERVVERGQLAGEGLRRAHRWPFAAS